MYHLATTRAFVFVLFLLTACIVFADGPSKASGSGTDISPTPFTTPAHLTPEQWREDLRYLAAELPKRHKNLFHTMTREQFEKLVRELDAKIPSLTQNQIALELARIVAMVRDGHTRLIPIVEPSMRFRAFPVSFYVFKEGVYIRAADKIYEAAVGGRVVKIGDVPIEQVIDKLSDYIPYENEMGMISDLPQYLRSPEVLQALGIVKDVEKVPFLIEKDGKTSVVELAPRDLISEIAHKPPPAGWVDARRNAAGPTPLWLTGQNYNYWGESGGFRFEYIKANRILYVQLNQVQDTRDKKLADFMNEVSAAARNNDVDKLVLDIRQNGGGNNFLVPLIIRPIIQLENLDKKGKLFVIIGRQTFSAAQNLVNALEKYTNATFVGEPTASHVNMYGDARGFTLPNSKITVRASTLWHQDNFELDKRTWTAPRIAAPLTFADYSQNIDSALQAVIDYKPQKTLSEIAKELDAANDLGSFRARAQEFLQRRENAYQNVESEINNIGYDLMRSKKFSEAIEVFKVNAELYPASANAFDSLGEAYANAGKREEAIRSYEKALKIDAGFMSSIEALQKLKGK